MSQQEQSFNLALICTPKGFSFWLHGREGLTRISIPKQEAWDNQGIHIIAGNNMEAFKGLEFISAILLDGDPKVLEAIQPWVKQADA